MKTNTAGIRIRGRKGVKGIDWASYLRPGHRNRMTHWLPYPRDPSAAPLGSHRGMDSPSPFTSLLLWITHISYTPEA